VSDCDAMLLSTYDMTFPMAYADCKGKCKHSTCDRSTSTIA